VFAGLYEGGSSRAHGPPYGVTKSCDFLIDARGQQRLDLPATSTTVKRTAPRLAGPAVNMHPHLHTVENQKSSNAACSTIRLAPLTQCRLRGCHRSARRMPRPRFPMEDGRQLHRRKTPSQHVPARTATRANEEESRSGQGEAQTH
jgi:hypothetical protein